MTIGMRNMSLPLEWKNVRDEALVETVIESSLWHKRFGHANYTSLKQMHDLGLTENVPEINHDNCMCDVCQLGK